MNLAGFVTWLAVAIGSRAVDPSQQPLQWTFLLAFLLALLCGACTPHRQQGAGRAVLLAIEAMCAIAVIWFSPRSGAAPVLLVVLMAQIAMLYPPRVTVAAAIALNTALYLLLREGGHREPLLATTLYVGFQAFAALSSHYAKTAETARDMLVRVNADLLATRALMADSARDSERLRLARELHDVAGHKLTAMTLNLRVLAGDPALRQRRELAITAQLATELLDDIRRVVQNSRGGDGLDLQTALFALAAPLPNLRLHLSIVDDVLVTDAAIAETILRLVQEALTNSARHARARTLSVQLTRDDRRLSIRIDDDGHVNGPITEGSGLTGMRERVAAINGTMTVSTNDCGALRIEAALPLRMVVDPETGSR